MALSAKSDDLAAGQLLVEFIRYACLGMVTARLMGWRRSLIVLA